MNAPLELQSVRTADLVAELERRRNAIDTAILRLGSADPDTERVLRAVSGAWGCQVGRLFRRGREVSTAEPRQAAMVILRETTGLTFQAIGTLFRRDHGTVMHAVQTQSARMLSADYARKFTTARAAVEHVAA
jgi:chromosomal replication initiation ATPase DnaA